MTRAGYLLVALGAVGAIAALSGPRCALAQWILGGSPVCLAQLNQQAPHVTSDTDGGQFIAWQDDRDSASTGFNIYAQRLNASGTPQWISDGSPVCTALGDQFNSQLVSDGANGAIIVWVDTRSGTHYDIYAQHLSPSGVPLWSPNGVRLATSPNNKYYTGLQTPMASDGMGGAIVAWEEVINGFDTDVYAQHIDRDGALMWGPRGIPVCTAASFQPHATVIADTGGAIIAWEDYRDYPVPHIYVQHIDAVGRLLWKAGGVLLSSSASSQQEPGIIAAGHGALVSWIDHVDPNSVGVFSQRIDSSGTALWTRGGVPVAVGPGPRENPVALANPGGDFVVVWSDCRTGLPPSGSDFDIYAQRLSSNGLPQWQPNGVAVCVARDVQGYQSAVPDGASGAIIVWADCRRGGSGTDIYAQRLSALGIPQWTSDGVPISDTTTIAFTPVAAVDAAGGVVTVWADDRNGSFDPFYATNWDIYAGHMTSSGTLDVASGSTLFRLLAPQPNPAATPVTVSFRLGATARVRLDIFNIAGQHVHSLTTGQYQPGDYSLVWDLRNSEGYIVPAGLYLLRLKAGTFASVRKLAVLR